MLLAVALVAGTLASMYAGARLAGFLLDFFRVESMPVRLVAKVLAVALALPAGYYLVERLFLRWSARKLPESPDTEK
jgi:hypothetical protein